MLQHCSAQGPIVSVASESELPPFSIALHDRWGNRTGPCEGLQCSVIVECAGCKPAHTTVEFGSSGRALVSGKGHSQVMHVSIVHCMDQGVP